MPVGASIAGEAFRDTSRLNTRIAAKISRHSMNFLNNKQTPKELKERSTP